jgi:coenzyme PQQ synthesis protein D (PqqD)
MSDPRFRRSPAALFRTAGSEVLLASADRDGVDLLPGTAAAVWLLLEEPASLAHLSEDLAELYAMPVERVVEDVEPLVDELTRRGWVERVDA